MTFLCSSPALTSEFQPRLLDFLHVPPELAPPDQYDDDTDEPAPTPSPSFCNLSAEIIHILQKLPLDHDPALTASLAAYTSLEDAWTSDTACNAATSILSSNAILTSSRTLSGVLSEIIKPLFKRDYRVTATGRVALAAQHGDRERKFSVLIPAWQQQPSTVQVFTWTLRALPAENLEENWGLLIPPLLALLDSSNTPTKTRGCLLLKDLLSKLSKTKSTLLERTGMGSVFWDALLPATNFLPPLTPTSHAVPLLRAAYSTLLALARSREPTIPAQKAKLLDAAIREGVLRGFQFAGDTVKVAEVLCDAVGSIANELGVYTVRHLQSLLPILSDVLANPFAITYPPLLRNAVKAEIVIIGVGWPRVPRYGAEILRGVCACWRRIYREGKGSELRDLEEALKAIVRALGTVFEKTDSKEKWNALVKEILGVDDMFLDLLTISDVS